MKIIIVLLLTIFWLGCEGTEISKNGLITVRTAYNKGQEFIAKTGDRVSVVKEGTKVKVTTNMEEQISTVEAIQGTVLRIHQVTFEEAKANSQ